MDDLLKSLKAQLYDRVTSPLLSSFLISWAIWNHRIFVVMLSSELKVKQKFAYADEILYPTFHEVALRGFLWPLLSALFILFVYPIPSRWVYQYVRKEQMRMKEIQQKIDDETPITKEEAKELRAAIRKADSEFQKEISERDAVIARLRNDIEKYEEDAKAQPEQPVAIPSDDQPEGDSDPLVDPASLDLLPLDNEQIELLRMIAEAASGVDEESAVLTAENRIVGKYNLDELQRMKLIKFVRNLRGPSRYTATPVGRASLVKLDRHRNMMQQVHKTLAANRSA